MSADKNTPPEKIPGQAAPGPEDTKREDKPKEKAGSPFGKDIIVGMYILINTKDNSVGVSGIPNIMNFPATAFGTMELARQQLEAFYQQRPSIDNKIIAGGHFLRNKMNFRNFWRGKKRF